MAKTEKKATTDLARISIDKLPGIGPTTAKNLKGAGYGTVEALASAPIAELCDIPGIGEKTARIAATRAQEILKLGWTTSTEEQEFQTKKRKYVTTSSNALDRLLGGGIMTHAVSELAGEFRTGKTQLCYQLAVNVQLPEEQGGLGKKAAWIDTEKTYFPERITAMAQAHKLDPDEVHDNIFYGLALNSDQQEDFAKQILSRVRDDNIGLLILDSLISHYRSEYTGRGQLAPRQQKLGRHIAFVARQVFLLGIACVVTNQVQAQPDAMFGGVKAAGGNIVGHAMTHRFMLKKMKGKERRLTIADSPLLPDSSVEFMVDECGIRDVPGKSKTVSSIT
ncbi:MAG: DNA repair and recombination protein RadA [Candidatus Heimdallarchaeota archaeon]